MNVFDLDQALVNDYERFARSFTLIRAPDIRQKVEELYASDRFWPEPLVSINPLFESGDGLTFLGQALAREPDYCCKFCDAQKDTQLEFFRGCTTPP
jgi:hypothetical protein